MATEEVARGQCHAVLLDELGNPTPCPTRAQPGHPYCSKHTGPLRMHKPESTQQFFEEWAQTAQHVIEKRLGRDKPVKGEHDPELVRALLPFAMPIYSLYWRVDTYGIENIPTEGPALLAANHSGTIPIDGAMLKLAVLKEHGRNPWLLAGDIAFKIPGFGELIKVAGNAPADRESTLDLMRKGELLGVFPEGYKGIGKGWKKRYQLQRFGRGGFVEVCMETGAPIIPVAIIGAEEAYPMIGNVKFLARRFGAPYFPITPTFPLLGPLGAIPLPSKWIIAFGEPIPMVQYGPKAVDDTQLVLELTDHVRQTVQDLINENLGKRRHTFI
ncbi:MAG TPA: lysophospholipid acyltransferase family protein [Actinomycetota bacterium]|nr:lysophospholipid acyltransferase family protein [Actinomycetota bacterium]